MADIKQAAQWVADGKRVRRPKDWAVNEWFELSLNSYFEWNSERGRQESPGTLLEVSDILADDWEIAGSPETKD